MLKFRCKGCGEVITDEASTFEEIATIGKKCSSCRTKETLIRLGNDDGTLRKNDHDKSAHRTKVKKLRYLRDKKWEKENSPYMCNSCGEFYWNVWQKCYTCNAENSIIENPHKKDTYV